MTAASPAATTWGSSAGHDDFISSCGGFASGSGDFASSRLCEVVIHADDVAFSVVLTATVDTAVVDVLVDLLTRTARARHGDLAVIRALTRAERVEAVFPVY